MLITPHAGMASDLDSLVARVGYLLRELEKIDMDEIFEPANLTDEEKGLRESTLAREQDEIADGLSETLVTIGVRVRLYAEALGLRETSEAVSAWARRWPASELHETQQWEAAEADGRESVAFNEIRRLVDGLLVLLRPEEEAPPDPTTRNDRERLEYCLRSLAKVCRERDVKPTSEKEMRDVMHSHLEAVFQDYVREPQITKPLVNFRADAGVQSLKVAIECKFVANKAEIATAVHGLTEDLSGYAGSADWTHFYSLVYMTEAFAVEGQFAHALGASGNAGSWTTILVTGAGARAINKKANPK